MSNLRSQLGPQGRALVGGGTFNNGPTPQELDFLCNELRQPKPDTTVHKVMGYLYNYVPYIKQEHNLRVVVSSFLNSPTCFSPPAPYRENFSIIEVIRLIFEKKLRVSQPTLTIKQFYTIWREELSGFAKYNQHVNSWKVLPVIAGIYLANDLRDQLYTLPNTLEYSWFFASFDKTLRKLFCHSLNYSLSPALPVDITHLVLLAMAVVYRRGDDVRQYTRHVRPEFIVAALVELMFGQRPDSFRAYRQFFDFPEAQGLAMVVDGDTVEQKIQQDIYQVPAIRYMNKLAFVLEGYLQKMPHSNEGFSMIQWSLAEILRFNDELGALTEASAFNREESAKNPPSFVEAQFWLTLKQVLFAEVIVFTGIMTRYITSGKRWSNPFSQNPYVNPRNKQVALKVLHNLYAIHFILVSVGAGGFDAYNFVYYLSNELALDTHKQYRDTTAHLVGPPRVNMDPAAINRNYVMQSRVLFVLGMWENYLGQPEFDSQFAQTFIFPFCYDLVGNPHYKNLEVIEAAHSVLLIYFSKTKHQELDECINYIGLLFESHPHVLSATQMSVAVETVGKALLANPRLPKDPALPDSAEEFMRFLYHMILPTRSVPLRNRNSSFKDQTIMSAQPVGEILATTTLYRMDEDQVDSHNIVEQNDADKPFDKVFGDISEKIYDEVNAEVNKYVPKKWRQAVEDLVTPKEYEFTERVQPETEREAAVNTIINLIPYLPLSSFTAWLDKIYGLIAVSSPSERLYLSRSLWVVIGMSLDLNRCELAYPWWYEKVRMPENKPFMSKF
ncbi:peroxisomal biogenesis factor 8 [Diutina catenulata]